MQIVELGDNSMVIMKDSEDPFWMSVGDIYRKAKNEEYSMAVGIFQYVNGSFEHKHNNFQIASEYIYSAGRLILFFKEAIYPMFHLHDKVYIHNLYLYNPYNKK